MSTDEKTAFAKAWEKYRAEHVGTFDARTITRHGPYLENRLHEAFSQGWRASALECAELLKVHI